MVLSSNKMLIGNLPFIGELAYWQASLPNDGAGIWYFCWRSPHHYLKTLCMWRAQGALGTGVLLAAVAEWKPQSGTIYRIQMIQAICFSVASSPLVITARNKKTHFPAIQGVGHEETVEREEVHSLILVLLLVIFIKHMIQSQRISIRTCVPTFLSFP